MDECRINALILHRLPTQEQRWKVRWDQEYDDHCVFHSDRQAPSVRLTLVQR